MRDVTFLGQLTLKNTSFGFSPWELHHVGRWGHMGSWNGEVESPEGPR